MNNTEEIGKLVDTMMSIARRDALDEVARVVRKLMDAEWEDVCDTDTVIYQTLVQVMLGIDDLWRSGKIMDKLEEEA